MIARRGSYGIDAPQLLPILGALFAANLVSGIASRTIWPLLGAAAILVCLGFGLFASRRGKFLVWDELLESLRLRGDERVLDLGCGRGAVLLLAAQRVPRGRAVGIDLWRSSDQSANSIEATRRNAEAELVADQVDLHTGDMQSLPFENRSFDLIVSNVALHNVPGTGGKEQVLDEAIRVLRPGGRIMIADLAGTALYARHLRERGMVDVRRQGLGWRVWWSGPWLPTRLVTAIKPLST